jgi:flagellar protein FlaI
MPTKTLDKYKLATGTVPAEVSILQRETEYVNGYELAYPQINPATLHVLDYLKERIIERTDIKASEILDPREADRVKDRVNRVAHELVKREVAGVTHEEEEIIVGRLVHEMLGLGEIELLLADENLEEIVVNSAQENVFVYHKRFGWLKTNLHIATEEQIQNYASIIARRVGKQITNLNPLLDARLPDGNRVNATLSPISWKGHGITIRRFRGEPWTMIDLIDNKTVSLEVAALLWLAVQYEISTLVGGGTASGKTSFLNSILVFTPPNQRIVSLEDTREITLPDFLHWTPMVTREPNPEGKGGVELLDLMINSLRMRPDRIVVGEMRRQSEAEVLFEAMHTGHSVFSTIHADDAIQVKSRLTGPPINLPEGLISVLPLVVVQFRDRRTGIRRTYEVAEFLPEENKASLNIVYQWNPRTDTIEKVGEYVRLINELSLHTGMSIKEIQNNIAEKKRVLEWCSKHRVRDINNVGRVVASHYRDAEHVAEVVKRDDKPEKLGLELKKA